MVGRFCIGAVAIAGFASSAAGDEPRTGYTAAVGAGLNVGTPLGELRLGRRFTRASHFEVDLDYSYNATISEFPFHAFGIGVRAYLLQRGRFELFHQTVASLAIASAGGFHGRDLPARLLGPMFTDGLGVAIAIDPCWHLAVSVAIGDPVWLRSDVAIGYVF